MAASKITARDMQGWCWATGHTLELWERRAIRALDNAWMTAQNDDAPRPKKATK